MKLVIEQFETDAPYIVSDTDAQEIRAWFNYESDAKMFVSLFEPILVHYLQSEKAPTPTPMPEWVDRQLRNAEQTVAEWSDGKREAAGIPRKPECDET